MTARKGSAPMEGTLSVAAANNVELHTDQSSRDTQRATVGAQPDSGHKQVDTQARSAAAESHTDHRARDTQDQGVGVQFGSDHSAVDAHQSNAVAELHTDHALCDTQNPAVGVQPAADGHGLELQPGGDHAPLDTHPLNVAVELQFCAAFLDDLENLRKATENRLRSFQQAGFDATPYVAQLDALRAAEHQAVLALQHALRRHPLGPWVKQTVGVGEKQGARLIAAIGDITYNHADDRPRRGPAELWAYCGYRPDQKRRKGQQSNWSAEAKMRAFLIAESCLKAKARSPYGPVYDRARAKWADRDTTDLHKHNHALRVVAKAILRDLFVEARRVGA